MSKLLIVYGTTEGQTAKISRRIADLAAELGHAAVVRDARDLPADFTLDGYAGVLVGASLHNRRYQSYVYDFVRRHRAELSRVPAGFFSVSWAAAWRAAGADQMLLTRFFEEVGWHPQTSVSFAGAVTFSRYGRYSLLTRLGLRAAAWVMARQLGKPTDASRDVEYTNWDEVGRFAEGFIGSLSREPAPTASQEPSAR